MLVGLCLLVACSDDRPDIAGPPATTVVTAAPFDPSRGSCWTTAGSSRADFDGQNGEFAAYLYQVDQRARSLAFDVVQWLVGDDARREYLRQNPTDPSGPPNDYMIVNALQQVDRAPVAANPRVWIRSAGRDGLLASTFEELPPARSAGRHPGLGLYWLTFERGAVTRICQQFTP